MSKQSSSSIGSKIKARVGPALEVVNGFCRNFAEIHEMSCCAVQRRCGLSDAEHLPCVFSCFVGRWIRQLPAGELEMVSAGIQREMQRRNINGHNNDREYRARYVPYGRETLSEVGDGSFACSASFGTYSFLWALNTTDFNTIRIAADREAQSRAQTRGSSNMSSVQHGKQPEPIVTIRDEALLADSAMRWGTLVVQNWPHK